MLESPFGRRLPVVAVAAVLLVGGAACGGDDGDASDWAGPGTTEVTDDAVGSADEEAAGRPADLGGLVDSCPAGADVADGAWEGAVTSAVGVDDPEVAGVGDPGFEDLGDPTTDVEHYHLRLEVDPSDGTIESGTANIWVTAEEDVEEISLDLVGMEVHAVAVDGAAVEAERRGARLVVPAELDEGGGAVVTVCFSGIPEPVPSRAIFGAKVGWQLAEGGVFVLSEPEGARSWYPVDDHPTDKATYDFELVVPEGWSAVTNGEGGLAEGSDPDGATRVYRWSMRDPMAPYLATVVIAPMEHRELGSVGGVPVGTWIAEGSPARAASAMEHHEEALEFLVEIFGPYPFSRLDSALIPGSVPGNTVLESVALETQALPIYGLHAVNVETVVHEVAHQWWGNSVSIESWTRDLWWVEGMATFSQWMWRESQDPSTYVDTRDSALRAVAMSDGSIGDLDPTDLFGQLTYQGGAVVFAALREEVGDAEVLQILRTFVERHAHSNASTDDLIAVASEVHGEDMSDFFAMWLGPAEARPTRIG